MTRWVFIRGLSVFAATFTLFSALIAALQAETYTALFFGILTLMNVAQYLNARQYP